MVVPWSRTSRAPLPQLLGRPLLFRVFSLQMLNGKDSQEDFKHRLQIEWVSIIGKLCGQDNQPFQFRDGGTGLYP